MILPLPLDPPLIVSYVFFVFLIRLSQLLLQNMKYIILLTAIIQVTAIIDASLSHLTSFDYSIKTTYFGSRTDVKGRICCKIYRIEHLSLPANRIGHFISKILMTIQCCCCSHGSLMLRLRCDIHYEE